MGVDDLIVEEGIECLERLVNRPLIIFLEPSMHLASELGDEDLHLIAASLKEREARTWLKPLEKTKGKQILKRARQVRFSFNSDLPHRKEKNEIIRYKKSESLKKTFLQLRDVLKSSEHVFRNADERSFVIPESDGVRYLFNSNEIAQYLSNFLTYREANINSEGVLKFGPHEKINLDVIGGYLQSTDNFQGLKSIRYASSFPIIRDGSLLAEPGYHEKAKFYYYGGEVKPSKENTKYLYRFLDSFPFEGEVDKVNMLGLLISLFDRLHFVGEFPIIAVKGDRQSLGKTMLMDCFSVIAEGREASLLSLGDENEIEKAVVSCLMNSNFVVLDNIKARTSSSVISSPFLEKAATTKELTARILGGNNNFVRPNTFILAFTLNGGVFSNDLLIRQVVISLNSAQQHRMNYDFDVLNYVKEYRSQIISALAYIRLQYKGIKTSTLEGLGNFKFVRFAKFINNVLSDAGITGFLSNQESIKSTSDPFLVALLDFLYTRLNEVDALMFSPAQIAEALPLEVFSEVPGRSNHAAAVGRSLTKYVDTVIGVEPRYYVKKMLSGNNPTYLFKIQLGGVGDNLKPEKF